MIVCYQRDGNFVSKKYSFKRQVISCIRDALNFAKNNVEVKINEFPYENDEKELAEITEKVYSIYVDGKLEYAVFKIRDDKTYKLDEIDYII